MSPVPADHRPRRPLIWIADDSPVEARFTEHSLGSVYDYEHFTDGSLVVERLAAGGQQPDVLLLDWVMPAMQGDDVCRFLRTNAATAELPIILVTASRIETADVVEGLAAGANDYVARPYVPEELRARVDTAIRGKRLRELAAREQKRLSAVGQLGQAFAQAGPNLESVVRALATSLVHGLCDGCAVNVLPAHGPAVAIGRHRTGKDEPAIAALAAVADPVVHTFASDEEALATLPPAYHPAIRRFGLRALAMIPFPGRSMVSGMVTVTRDGHSQPFEPEDLATLETCVEYAAMALENALRFESERTARAQLDAILEQLPIGIVVANRDGKLTHVNQAISTILPGMPSAQTVAQIRERFTLRQLDGTPLTGDEQPLVRALRGEDVRAFEMAVDLPGRDRTFIRASAVPMRDARGNVVAALAAFDDVSAEHRVAEFQRYVVGIVGHDLRNPLNTLSMGLQALERLVEAEKPRQIVARMAATGERMRRIINQLLDATRTQLGGGIPVEASETDLNQVVSGVLNELAIAYPRASFTPVLDPAARGKWDGDRLAQVVSNLVSNAIQYGTKDAPVEVETRVQDGHALLRVRNATTAAPLDTEQIRALFEPFHKGGAGPAGRTGLGLGLYIVQEILRAHHGELLVESAPGRTTFTARLPLQR